jgi:uncharacterized protein (TIGR02466 family)|tara:strand:- start:1804 stop:2484 length:681 start_codon:yes stop_codon:yes gene_type:complete
MKDNKFPKTLSRENIFPTPIWVVDEPSHVNKFNKATDIFIKKAKRRDKNQIHNKRNKALKIKGDIGSVYLSESLINVKDFKPLQDYVLATSHNLLEEMGFSLKDFKLFMTEMWVQEFAKDGGGHHSLHTHWNGHISAFYFLKGSEKTSRPIFEDPRPGNLMNLLPLKDEQNVVYGTHQINYVPKPGRFIFFPSYLPHLYTVDLGVEPFRFIHFNCQAIPKGVLNVV